MSDDEPAKTAKLIEAVEHHAAALKTALAAAHAAVNQNLPFIPPPRFATPKMIDAGLKALERWEKDDPSNLVAHIWERMFFEWGNCL